jgi:hypothetical protein
MHGFYPPHPFAIALGLRRIIACALVGLIAFVPLAAVSAGKTPIARTGFPVVPANETEPDAEETEAKLSLRAHVRWSPPGTDSTARNRPFPRPCLASKSLPDRHLPALSPTDGPRLRC